jgi:NADH-quinone oxidoreductase subunit N
MQLPVVDIGAVAPEFVIVMTGLLVLVLDLFNKSGHNRSQYWLSIGGLLLAFVATWLMIGGTGDPDGPRIETAFSGMVAVDPYGQFFKFIFILSAFFTILMSPRYLRINNISQSEYLELILFATLGMMVMVAAADFVVFYVGLELMSIAIYLMAGFQKGTPRSSEASLKYFLLGSFASAILLYGISFLYGITGSTNLSEIAYHLDIGEARMLTVALVLISVGFAFKIAAVPFHMWTPDVYEGAPTPLTAFMSVGPKVAGFAVLMRIYVLAFDNVVEDWTRLFALLAVLTVVVGNVIAVAQNNIKRMLAYSSIAHAGYLLIGVVAAGSTFMLNGVSASEPMSSVMIYLFSYMFMNMGAFAIVISLGRADDPCESLQDYAGLARRRPGMAALMLILLLSLAGIPGTFGFIGKLYIFKAAVQTQNYGLAIIGVVASVVAAFYYIRVIVYMYMREPEEGAEPDAESAATTVYVAIATTVFTVLFGLFPNSMVTMAHDAVALLLQS